MAHRPLLLLFLLLPYVNALLLPAAAAATAVTKLSAHGLRLLALNGRCWPPGLLLLLQEVQLGRAGWSTRLMLKIKRLTGRCSREWCLGEGGVTGRCDGARTSQKAARSTALDSLSCGNIYAMQPRTTQRPFCGSKCGQIHEPEEPEQFENFVWLSTSG
ncbi:hypothetical protein EDC01DRAFT_628974 [Geopyxis carbonaria]|nr:hypothetical protein EDC01DRAFT_628974 [Geopyxis carbonaria]